MPTLSLQHITEDIILDELSIGDHIFTIEDCDFFFVEDPGIDCANFFAKNSSGELFYIPKSCLNTKEEKIARPIFKK